MTEGDYISRSELFNRLAYVQLSTEARTIIYTILQGMHGIDIKEVDHGSDVPLR